MVKNGANMDIAELRDPVEVWELVTKNPEALITFLRSDEKIGFSHREALALYFEGKLKPARKRGRPSDVRSFLERISKPTKLEALASLVELISERARKYKKLYGNSDKIIDAVANKYGEDTEALRNHIRRSMKRVIKSDATDWLILQFQNWYEKREKEIHKK